MIESHETPANQCSQPLPLLTRIKKLRETMARSAQKLYDDWDDKNYGGICDLIAEEISEILSLAGIDSTLGGHDGDDHAYVVAYDANNSYVVDIHHSVYEIGGGYNWTKIPGVKFTENDVDVVEIERPDYADD